MRPVYHKFGGGRALSHSVRFFVAFNASVSWQSHNGNLVPCGKVVKTLQPRTNFKLIVYHTNAPKSQCWLRGKPYNKKIKIRWVLLL